MEHGSSLPHSQKPPTFAHPEPHQFRPYPNLTFRLSILILSSHLRLDHPSGRSPSDFPLQFNQTRNINSFCVPYQKRTILVLRLCRNRLVSGRNYTLLCHNTEPNLHHFFNNNNNNKKSDVSVLKVIRSPQQTEKPAKP